jgi:pimeloyl-ACP methyl ester carboxylesterase
MPTLPPPPGTLIDVGGYRLHFQIEGTGQPAVIMDSGLGATSILFAVVLPAVARFTCAIAFDRAGYPWSDPAPPHSLRTSTQIVAELRIALQQAEIPPPYILVGLSFGGINMLTYALNYPDEVAGLILLDPSHPEMFERVPGIPSVKVMKWSTEWFTPLARWGWLRPLAGLLAKSIVPYPENLPPAAWEVQKMVGVHPATFEAATRESTVATKSFAKARVAKGALGEMPLWILTGAEQWVKGRPTAMKRAMLELRDELATGSTRGEHRIVAGSGHIVPIDRPDVVIATIRKMVELVKHGKR